MTKPKSRGGAVQPGKKKIIYIYIKAVRQGRHPPGTNGRGCGRNEAREGEKSRDEGIETHTRQTWPAGRGFPLTVFM